MADGFVPQSLDTDLGTLIRDEGSDMHDAVLEVAGGGAGAAAFSAEDAPTVPNSTATTVAALVADHNSLLAALRDRGIIS